MTSVLVYGGTGAQGSAVVRELLSQGFEVRAITRNGQKARVLEALGASVLQADLSDPASLAAANRGIDRVLLFLPVGFDRSRGCLMGRNAIDAAVEAGASLIVYNASGPIPAEETGSATADIKRDVAEYLKAGAVPWIVLQPTIYLDNFVQPWAAPSLMRGLLRYPIPARFKVAWISWQDNAACCAAAISRPQFNGRSLLIGGEALTGPELASRFEAQLGHAVRFESTDIAEFENAINGLLGAPCGTELGTWYRWVARQRSSPYVGEGASELGVRPRMVEQWIGAQDWERWRI